MKRSKKLSCQLWFLRILSFILTFLPLIVGVVMGFANQDIHKGSKIFLGFTLIVAAIITIVNILLKYHLRSPLFLILLGIYYALHNIMTFMVIISIGIVIDEFFIAPAIKRKKTQLIARKEIDYDDNE